MKDSKSLLKNFTFKENSSTLDSRIEIHKKFSKLEINDWILEHLKLNEGEIVLDVGCGTAKQSIPYKRAVGVKGIVVGADISDDLIKEARKNAEEANLEIKFIVHDANTRFDFPNEYFDVITCSFAIYYVKNLEQVILEFKRLLKQKGRMFLIGPTPDNAKLLHDLHQKVTQKPLPYMPGISRFMSEVLPIVRKQFQQIKVELFQNSLKFDNIDPFMQYYSSTGLLISSTEGEENRKTVLDKMKTEAQELINKEGQIEIIKNVGGILAYK